MVLRTRRAGTEPAGFGNRGNDEVAEGSQSDVSGIELFSLGRRLSFRWVGARCGGQGLVTGSVISGVVAIRTSVPVMPGSP